MKLTPEQASLLRKARDGTVIKWEREGSAPSWVCDDQDVTSTARELLQQSYLVTHAIGDGDARVEAGITYIGRRAITTHDAYQ